jgi:hypothetical protein
MNMFLAGKCNTGHAVIGEPDVHTIFFKIPELHTVHSNFIRDLQPIVDAWSHDSCIAEQFKILVSHCLIPPATSNVVSMIILAVGLNMFHFTKGLAR